MSSNEAGLSPAFVESQRQRLEALRDQIQDYSAEAAARERDLSQHHNEVQDSGDAGAIEARRNSAEAFSAKGELRLGEIRRALEKIAEGSYGLSDESGEPIGHARLTAVPEARFTIDEETRRER